MRRGLCRSDVDAIGRLRAAAWAGLDGIVATGVGVGSGEAMGSRIAAGAIAVLADGAGACAIPTADGLGGCAGDMAQAAISKEAAPAMEIRVNMFFPCRNVMAGRRRPAGARYFFVMIWWLIGASLASNLFCARNGT